VVSSSRHAETTASPRGGEQGWTAYLAPHPSAGREDPRREEITTKSHRATKPTAMHRQGHTVIVWTLYGHKKHPDNPDNHRRRAFAVAKAACNRRYPPNNHYHGPRILGVWSLPLSVQKSPPHGGLPFGSLHGTRTTTVVLSACCKEGSMAVAHGALRYRKSAGQRASPGTVERFPSSRRGFDSRHPLQYKGFSGRQHLRAFSA